MNELVIQTVLSRLIEEYKPEAIFIFGSHAWGQPNPDSDLDLLVILSQSDEKPYKRVIRGLKVLRGLNISKDLLVYTRDEFEEMRRNKGSLCYKIMHEGIKAYEAA